MKRPSYDVLTEPWIPVIQEDGSRDELGIRLCLEQADRLAEIRHPSPIVEFGLYRLLVAFMLDVLDDAERRPEIPEDLTLIMEDRHFDAQLIRDYIQMCGNVFDLFDPERPFLQSKLDSKKRKPIAGMYPAIPSGTNVGLWHHQDEEDIAISAHDAAQWLATIAPFMTAGGAGLSPSINGAPAIYTLTMGKSLFETITMNIPLRNDQESGDGLVAWRSTRIPGGERTQATAVEALTWQPRQIQLIPELAERGNIQVRVMNFEKGDKARIHWTDPNLAYWYMKEKRAPVRMREGRPLWRDAGPLFLLREANHGGSEKKVVFKRPDVVDQALACMRTNEQLSVHAYGIRTDMKMKIFEWSDSRWSVPTKLGRSTRLGMLVHNELERAESAAYVLRTQIAELSPREEAGGKDALRSVANRCERAYWRHLERGFAPLMSAFAELDPEESPNDPALIAEVASDWRRAIERLALEQFESVAKDMDADSDALRRLVWARAGLKARLGRVMA